MASYCTKILYLDSIFPTVRYREKIRHQVYRNVFNPKLHLIEHILCAFRSIMEVDSVSSVRMVFIILRLDAYHVYVMCREQKQELYVIRVQVGQKCITIKPFSQ